jgi:hypothetical protein
MKRLKIVKVPGTENIADLATKYHPTSKLSELQQMIGLVPQSEQQLMMTEQANSNSQTTSKLIIPTGMLRNEMVELVIGPSRVAQRTTLYRKGGHNKNQAACAFSQSLLNLEESEALLCEHVEINGLFDDELFDEDIANHTTNQPPRSRAMATSSSSMSKRGKKEPWNFTRWQEWAYEEAQVRLSKYAAKNYDYNVPEQRAWLEEQPEMLRLALEAHQEQDYEQSVLYMARHVLDKEGLVGVTNQQEYEDLNAAAAEETALTPLQAATASLKHKLAEGQPPAAPATAPWRCTAPRPGKRPA